MTRRFDVWAPSAGSVELAMGAARHAMRRAGGGWWTAGIDAPDGLLRYGYLLDGDGPFPDPRSPSQPDGVHGLSETVDHAAFSWTDGAWRPPALATGVFYELHIGTFSPEGTFDAATRYLSHFVELGVTHLELLPVAEFSGDRGWGYDGVDLWAPHHAYGGPDGLKRLVDACHAMGLAVVLDVVYNHFGPEGNHVTRFGPYLTDRYRTPWGEAINLDGPGSDEVRRFVIDNARMWLRDYHVDGLRLDAVHAITDGSAMHILEELARSVAGLASEVGRELVLIAESDLNDPRLVHSWAVGGYGLDAHWADDVHHALHAAITGEQGGYYADFADFAVLQRALRDGYVFQGEHSAVRDRRHGRPPEGVAPSQLIASLQNHDQVGNRARGDRLATNVPLPRVIVGITLLLTAPFVPLLFAGEEWGTSSSFAYFSGHAAAELADAVRAGRRAEFAQFGWEPESIPDPQDPATYEGARLRWEERDLPRHAKLLRVYRELLSLRRELGLSGPARNEVEVDAERRTLLIRRGPVAVAANLGRAAWRVDLAGTLRFASDASVAHDGKRLSLPSDTVGIVVANS
ncbi:MAG: malto-oligosyltrehalose trehalohydrolase [Chloroflexota bacterium]